MEFLKHHHLDTQYFLRMNPSTGSIEKLSQDEFLEMRLSASTEFVFVVFNVYHRIEQDDDEPYLYLNPSTEFFYRERYYSYEFLPELELDEESKTSDDDQAVIDWGLSEIATLFFDDDDSFRPELLFQFRRKIVSPIQSKESREAQNMALNQLFNTYQGVLTCEPTEGERMGTGQFEEIVTSEEKPGAAAREESECTREVLQPNIRDVLTAGLDIIKLKRLNRGKGRG